MKKKVLLSSCLTIALCLCLIAGSTLALFEKKAEVNIAVTAGKLDVTATIQAGKVLTHSAGDANEFSRNGDFANGGSAVVQQNSDGSQSIVASGMTPGDAIRFNIDVTNKSNVATQYRVVWKSNVDGTVLTDLANAFNVTAVVNGETLNFANKESEYFTADAVAEGTSEVVTNFQVTVAFKDEGSNTDNAYQGATANISFIIEAVQDNGVPTTATTTTTP